VRTALIVESWASNELREVGPEEDDESKEPSRVAMDSLASEPSVIALASAETVAGVTSLRA
jgi:hypothetical protein